MNLNLLNMIPIINLIALEINCVRLHNIQVYRTSRH